jgi:hypothetical protein
VLRTPSAPPSLSRRYEKHVTWTDIPPILLTNPTGATSPQDPGQAENSSSERSKVGWPCNRTSGSTHMWRHVGAQTIEMVDCLGAGGIAMRCKRQCDNARVFPDHTDARRGWVDQIVPVAVVIHADHHSLGLALSPRPALSR